MDKDFKRRGCVHVANYAFRLMEKFMRREPMKLPPLRRPELVRRETSPSNRKRLRYRRLLFCAAV